MAEKKTPDTEAEKVVPMSWEDMREVTLPRARKGEENFQYVSVNGRGYQVPRNGKPQLVPYPIYERILLMQEAEEAQEDFRDEIPNEVAPKQV